MCTHLILNVVEVLTYKLLSLVSSKLKLKWLRSLKCFSSSLSAFISPSKAV